MAKERFINRQAGKNAGRIAYVARRDEEAKTVLLVYEDSADGKDGTKVSYSTLKRWWKKVQDETPEAQPSEAPEDGDDVCADGTPYTQVMQEIIQDAKRRGDEAKKAKASKKASGKKEKAELSAAIQEVCDYVFATVQELGGETFVPANGMKMRTFKVGGHMFAKFDFSNKRATLACREAAVDTEPDKTVNHMFKNLYFFTVLNGESKKKIKQLLKDSYKFQDSKNTSKEDK